MDIVDTSCRVAEVTDDPQLVLNDPEALYDAVADLADEPRLRQLLAGEDPQDDAPEPGGIQWHAAPSRLVPNHPEYFDDARGRDHCTYLLTPINVRGSRRLMCYIAIHFDGDVDQS